MEPQLVRLLRLQVGYQKRKNYVIQKHRMDGYRLQSTKNRLDMQNDIMWRELAARYSEPNVYILHKSYTVHVNGLQLHEILTRKRHYD